MDPVTVIGAANSFGAAAKVLWDAGNYLYDFYKDTKKVNQTVYDLSQQVKSLSTVCALVQDGLKEAQRYYGPDGSKKGPSESDDGLLWPRLTDQLSNCEKVGLDLNKLYEIVQQDETTFAKQVKRQFNLNRKAREMESIHKRVTTYTSTLQLSLSVLNM